VIRATGTAACSAVPGALRNPLPHLGREKERTAGCRSARFRSSAFYLLCHLLYVTSGSQILPLHQKVRSPPSEDSRQRGKEKQIATNSARQRLNLQGAVSVGRNIKALITLQRRSTAKALLICMPSYSNNNPRKK
jgi:hypothetical protein